MVRTAQIRGVIRLKLVITVVLAIALLLILGQKAAIASALGGSIAILGSVLYATIAYSVKFAPAAEIMRRHFAAEMAKLCCTLLAFAALFVFYRQADWVWVFVGYLAAASAYWFGLLIQFDGKK
jgi:ATP synthase protein I